MTFAETFAYWKARQIKRDFGRKKAGIESRFEYRREFLIRNQKFREDVARACGMFMEWFKYRDSGDEERIAEIDKEWDPFWDQVGRKANCSIYLLEPAIKSGKVRPEDVCIFVPARWPCSSISLIHDKDTSKEEVRYYESELENYVRDEDGIFLSSQGGWAKTKGDQGKNIFLRQDRFLTIDIDLTQPNEVIRGEIDFLVTLFKKWREDHGLPSEGRKEFGKLDDYKKVWDLKEEGKTDTEIIQIMWPEEWDKTSSKKKQSEPGTLYEKLCTRFRREGKDNWDEQAWNEAFGKEGSEATKLYVRVRDSLRAADKLIRESYLEVS